MVTLGFLQPHKGFDRAIDAFVTAGLASRHAHLHVVGAVRTSEPHFVQWADQLGERVNALDGVTLHRGFVSDRQFDAWIAAADVVVLPYRIIWSSGVMERCRLFGTPVIASRVGGVADQAPEGTVLVGDDHELLTAMVQAADRAGCPPLPGPAAPTAWLLSPNASVADIQSAIAERAATTT
jgi:glycosyltransferase involved in cell wall biosynthesis